MSSKLDSRKLRLGAFLAVMGPGIIAWLSDDDPAGITTYSQLGAQFGYQLLWTLGISTIALILFQDLGARIGVVTRQGLIGLVRQKVWCSIRNVECTCTCTCKHWNYDSRVCRHCSGGNLFGNSKYVTVPLAGIVVSFLVLRGSFARVEKVSFLLSFGIYCLCNCRLHGQTSIGTAAAHGLFILSTAIKSRCTIHSYGNTWYNFGAMGISFYPELRSR
jgi:Mn2+/Fe2+ NRAMP family transporter